MRARIEAVEGALAMPKIHDPAVVSLERALSKLGIASRTQAREWILAGRVRVDGQLRRNPGFAVIPEA